MGFIAAVDSWLLLSVVERLDFWYVELGTGCHLDWSFNFCYLKTCPCRLLIKPEVARSSSSCATVEGIVERDLVPVLWSCWTPRGLLANAQLGYQINSCHSMSMCFPPCCHLLFHCSDLRSRSSKKKGRGQRRGSSAGPLFAVVTVAVRWCSLSRSGFAWTHLQTNLWCNHQLKIWYPKWENAVLLIGPPKKGLLDTKAACTYTFNISFFLLSEVRGFHRRAQASILGVKTCTGCCCCCRLLSLTCWHAGLSITVVFLYLAVFCFKPEASWGCSQLAGEPWKLFSLSSIVLYFIT